MTAGQDFWLATVSTVSDRDTMKWCLQPAVDAIEKTRQEIGQLSLSTRQEVVRKHLQRLSIHGDHGPCSAVAKLGDTLEVRRTTSPRRTDHMLGRCDHDESFRIVLRCIEGKLGELGDYDDTGTLASRAFQLDWPTPLLQFTLGEDTVALGMQPGRKCELALVSEVPKTHQRDGALDAVALGHSRARHENAAGEIDGHLIIRLSESGGSTALCSSSCAIGLQSEPSADDETADGPRKSRRGNEDDLLTADSPSADSAVSSMPTAMELVATSSVASDEAAASAAGSPLPQDMQLEAAATSAAANSPSASAGGSSSSQKMELDAATSAAADSPSASAADSSLPQETAVEAATSTDVGSSIDGLQRACSEARTAWVAAVAAVSDAQLDYDAHANEVRKRAGELERRQRTAANQRDGSSENARKLNAECSVLGKSLESASSEKEQARSRLETQQGEEQQRNGAVDAAVDALNVADACRRSEPEKWTQMHKRGGTKFRKGEHPLKLPSAKMVAEQTAFQSIFNGGFHENGDPIRCPDGVGGRWHGRKAAGGEDDAAWVSPLDAEVQPWLGESGLNWLATTTGEQTKALADMHALKAGVDSRGQNAKTPEQTPQHADSCWPNSHVAKRAPWGDAHLVMIMALQDGTTLPTYPFDKDGVREIVDLDEGDIYIFRGDLIHVGAEYDTLNIRIHCYINSPSAPEPRDPDATYYVREDSWPIGRQ